MKTDRRVLSIVGFAFLITAIVAPFVGWILISDDGAIVYAVVATLLGLVFGYLGRSFLLGKVALIGSLILIVLGAVNYVRFLYYRGVRPLPAHSRTYFDPELNRSLGLILTIQDSIDEKT